MVAWGNEDFIWSKQEKVRRSRVTITQGWVTRNTEHYSLSFVQKHDVYSIACVHYQMQLLQASSKTLVIRDGNHKDNFPVKKSKLDSIYSLKSNLQKANIVIYCLLQSSSSVILKKSCIKWQITLVSFSCIVHSLYTHLYLIIHT